MRIAGILAAVTLSLVSLPARAQSAKAWSAAKAGLPADAKLVFVVDLAALQKTQVFAMLWPKLVERADAAKVLDAMKAECKIDPLVAVRGFVVAMTEDHEDGAAYVSIAGLDKAKLSSCLQRQIQTHGEKGAKVAIKHDGNITQVGDGTDSMFLGWASKDVVVVPLGTQDRATVVKWMGGKGALAKTSVGKALAKLNASAALWGAGEGSREFEPGVVVKGGSGAVAFAKGNVDVNLRARLESAEQAQKMTSTVQKQLDDARQASLLPPAIASMVKAVTVVAAGDEVAFKANVVETELVGALTLALGAM